MVDLRNDEQTSSSDATAATESRRREIALKSVQRKRKVVGDAVAYVVINLFLIGVWAFTGRHYFWPGWVLAGWGVALVLDVWNTYFRRPITESDIDREMRPRR